jgi:hypothetical protein
MRFPSRQVLSSAVGQRLDAVAVGVAHEREPGHPNSATIVKPISKAL